MRILYFTQLFYPALFGGGEYIFYQWANELAKKGHNISVITQNLTNEKSEDKVNGIKIFRVGTELEPSGTLPTGIADNLSYLVSAFFKGIQIVKKNKIDLIHSNTYIPTISAHLCSKITGIPHIATVHDVYSTSTKDFWNKWSTQKGISKSTQTAGPFVEKLISKLHVSMFHTVSEQSKQDLISLGVKQKITVIPNGIDPSQYENNYTKTKNQAIFVGRLIFYKNVETILDAFGLVIKKIPDAKLVIVGDGPTKQSLIEKTRSLGIQNNVTFTGRVSHQDKVKMLSQSQVLLNPSIIEGFGIVVLEGFACGIPAIVSDSKPLSDLVDDSKDGYVVSATDPQKWAVKILDIFSNEKKSQDMGMAGKDKIISKYSISKISADLLELYKKITI
jgi:glycosyltransferase involved in cell wall biosynthesis